MYRKIGKSTCQKKKKVPPCEDATVSSEVPNKTQCVSGWKLQVNLKDVPCQGWRGREAKEMEEGLPVRSKVLHDVRPGGEDLLARGSEGSLGLLAFGGPKQSAIENCGRLLAQ